MKRRLLIHETRVIPIGDRPHLSSGIQQYLGDARAHGDGDTLVIETTNFNGRAPYRGSSEGLVMTERFRRVGADALRNMLSAARAADKKR
jgi:hypothetical protein